MRTTRIIDDYHHIDNGGVIVSIVDAGYKENDLDKEDHQGIFLEIETSYFGYPGIKSSIRIDSLGPEWLEKIGKMFFAASNKIREMK